MAWVRVVDAAWSICFPATAALFAMTRKLFIHSEDVPSFNCFKNKAIGIHPLGIDHFFILRKKLADICQQVYSALLF